MDYALMGTYRKIIEMKPDIPEDIYGPFIPYVFDEYVGAKTKMLVFGQQTFGWHNLKEVWEKRELYDKLSTYTKGFKNGKDYYSSPFWRFIHMLNKRLNDEDPFRFVWSNLNKIEQNNGMAGSPFIDYSKNEMNTLSNEITIINPDIILFLTGPYYDELLHYMVPNLKIQNDNPTLKINEFAKLDIFGHVAYRLYHPAYLQRSKKFDQYLDIISNKIITE